MRVGWSEHAFEKIPNGRYTYTDVLDNDGITDEPIEIRVAIEIEDDTALVDFTGTDPSGPRFS